MTPPEDVQLRAIAARIQDLDDKVTRMTRLLNKLILETQIQAVRAERDAAIVSLAALYDVTIPVQARGYNKHVAEIQQEAANKIKQLQTMMPQ